MIGVDEYKEKPTGRGFLRAAPNPFNSSTCMTFSLAAEACVQVMLYNVAGQRIKTILDRVMGPGIHTVTVDGHDGSGEVLPSGLYLYQFRTKKTIEYGRLVKL